MAFPGHLGSWGSVKPPPGTTINYGHPIAQGLSLCFLFNEGSGVPSDLVSGHQLTTVPTWVKNRYGGGIRSTSGGYQTTNASRWGPVAVPFSTFALISDFLGSATYASIVTSTNPPSGRPRFSHDISEWFNSGKVGMTKAAVTNDPSALVAPTGTTPIGWATRRDLKTDVYVGAVAGQCTNTSGFNTGGSGAIDGKICDDNGTKTFTTSVLYFWKRWLPANDMLALVADPYCFLLAP